MDITTKQNRGGIEYAKKTMILDAEQTQSEKLQKQIERENIEKLTREFLENGGKVQTLKSNESAFEALTSKQRSKTGQLGGKHDYI